MTTAAPLQNLAAKPRTPGDSGHACLLLQRKCACGAPTASLTGECAECKSKKRLQTKLAIGASHDPLEQEADRVADQVLAAPKNQALSPAPPRIQRFTGQAASQAAAAPASVDRVLFSAGKPLEPALRQDMEHRFGHDFSRVRVHSDTAAGHSAKEMNARAYTVGHDIVFGAGQFAPSARHGQALLAHELTHVVQTGPVTQDSPQAAAPIETLEREASSVADALSLGKALPPVKNSARNLEMPLREPEGPDLGTFGNLPQDEPDEGGLRTRAVLAEKEGVWYENRPNGQKWRAQGKYDFVVQNGKIWAVKGSSHVGGRIAGHTEAAAGGRVQYAGQVRFGSSSKARGTLQEWSNASGHYAAVRYFATNAGLPMDKFKPVEGGFPDKGPQLPVIQPKKGETLVPRGAGDSAANPSKQTPQPPAQAAPPQSMPAPAGKAPTQGQLPPSGGAAGAAAKSAAKGLSKAIGVELAKSLKITRAAQAMRAGLVLIQAVGALLLLKSMTDMAQSKLSSPGFILTAEIERAQALADQSRELESTYPAYSESVTSKSSSLLLAPSDPASLQDVVIALFLVFSDVIDLRDGLARQIPALRQALKEIKAKRAAAEVILQDPKAAGVLGAATLSTAELAQIFAAWEDLGQLDSKLGTALSGFEAVEPQVKADADYLRLWLEWLKEAALGAAAPENPADTRPESRSQP